MGSISKKLKTRFARWGGKFRQQMKREPIPLPKDVHDVQSLVPKATIRSMPFTSPCRTSRQCLPSACPSCRN